MELRGTNYCINCMKLMQKNNKCPHCGFVQTDYHPSPRCLLAGTELSDRYVLGKVLGEGSFGITYIGLDYVTEQVVAIKEYCPTDYVSRDVVRGSSKDVYLFEKEEKNDYAQELNKFLNEARCMVRFNHLPSLVKVRDFFNENNTAYIVMDYVSGMTVKQVVKENGPFSSDKVFELFRPLLTSLGSIHESGIVHRDISPDNIILSDSGELVLIDFGAARVRNIEMTRSITVVFKKGFSPEEQYRSTGKQGPSSDIYALCATMYFMITGEVPIEAIERMLGTNLKPISSYNNVKINKQCELAIEKGLAVKASDRYNSIHQLYNEIYEKNITKKIIKRKILFAVGHFEILVIAATTFFAGNVFNSNDSRKENLVKLVNKPAATVETKTETSVAITQDKYTEYKFPKLVGLTQDKAKKKLQSSENMIKIKYVYKYYENTKKSIVVKQNIPVGKICVKEKPVICKLTISKGAKKRIVPSLVGKSTAAAITKLTELKLKSNVNYEYSEKTRGTVINQSVAKGKKVKKGSQINLTVSMGKNPSIKNKSTTKSTNKKSQPQKAAKGMDVLLD